MSTTAVATQWMCMVCGFIYDEVEGWPEGNVDPGTPFAALPPDWLCPDCGVGKDEFVEVPE